MSNTALWEIQKSLVSTLTSSTTLSSIIGSKIYDEPPTNQQYPYIVVTAPTEVSDNTLNRIGFESTLTFFIYTKPEGLGWYQAETILDAMNEVLNVKKPTLANLDIRFCKNDEVSYEKIEDKRIIISRYRIWSEQQSLHNI